MKKYIYSATCLCGVLALASSCSDFLDEENHTGMNAEYYTSTKAGIEGLVNSCYAYTRAWWGKEPSLGLSDAGSDLWYTGIDNKQNTLNTYTFSSASLDDDTSNNPCFDQYWEMFYDAIDVCNNALQAVEGNTVITESERKQLRGEVEFCRALYYYNMVALWGPIPYNTEPITSDILTTESVRVPEAQVFANILADLDAATNDLSNISSTSLSSTHWVPSIYAVYALKARVALFAASWLGKSAVSGYSNLYQTAQEAAEQVIASNKFSFYDRYTDTWSMDNNEVGDNKEAIWGVYYSEDQGTGNCIPYRYKTSASGSALSFNSLITRTGYTRGGSAQFLMYVPTWNNGNTADLGNGQKNNCLFVRPTSAATSYIVSKKTGENVNIAPYYAPYGRGFARYLPSLYLWQELEKVRATDQRADGSLVTHYNIVADLEENKRDMYPHMGEFINEARNTPAQALERDGNYFNAGDTAIYYACVDGDSPEGQKLQAWAKDRYRIQFAFGGDIPVYTTGDPATAEPTTKGKATSDIYGDNRYNNTKIAGKNSFPGLKKFLIWPYDQVNYCHDCSSRDAFVFRLAEMYLIKAECQIETASSADALNTLNELRQARAIEGQEAANCLTGTVDVETILHERALELCGEYIRWFDLKRTHTLIDHIKKYNAQASGNIALKHYYRPIPLAQMDACTNVTAAADATQNDNGVLNYSTTAAGFWQTPGY